MLSQKFLRNIISYNQDTGKLCWRHDRANGKIMAGDEAGWKQHGYIHVQIGKKCYPAHRLAWLWMTGKMPEYPKEEIDHIDNNRSNNSWDNLRLVSKEQNLWNCKKYSNNSSGFKGVCFHKGTGKWASSVSISGKNKHIGYFKTPLDAYIAYVNVTSLLRGEYARMG